MSLPTVRQLFLLCLICFLGSWSSTDASSYDQWEDGIELRKVRGVQSDDLSDVLWDDQNEEQVQNVFKRFLFHYSKARNSVGAVQHQSHSVHPLMRLSPKLSQRRKKKVLLLVRFTDADFSSFFLMKQKIRGLPEGML
ncbi:neuromedin-S [Sebastes umbrosus]|uniref:neuromedin-S n=1 Tax=Sebastes umbrosus TaxID=72105 RepID=UPI00189EF55C|nr:neuromedin-S [Sebastes umbrosus]